MPIVRSYQCNECGYRMNVHLRMDQWETPAPECPQCQRFEMGQEFQPPAIIDSDSVNIERARNIAKKIAEEDMGVADMDIRGRRGEPNKVRYKEAPPPSASQWVAASQQLQQGIAAGSQTRAEGYDGLKDYHAIPDVLSLSKRRMLR